MAEYRVLFGQKYANETHPDWGFAHPDGWVSIEAPSYEVARAWLIEAIGAAWSDLLRVEAYPLTEWLGWYPAGCLAAFDLTTSPVPGEPSLSSSVEPVNAAGPVPAAPETGDRVRPSRRPGRRRRAVAEVTRRPV